MGRRCTENELQNMVLKNRIKILLIISLLVITFYHVNRHSEFNLYHTNLEPIKTITQAKEPSIFINSENCHKIKNKFSILSNELLTQSTLSFHNIHVDNHGVVFRLRKFHKSGIQKFYQYNVYQENSNEEVNLIEKNVGSEGALYKKIKNENLPILFQEMGLNHNELFLFYQNGKLKMSEGKFENQNIHCELF